tara:strand:+ start:278 stop:544 length:267 start_codon:yes stop_codon:yes gene_type:complete
MSDKITHIKPKTKKQETIGDIMGLKELFDEFNTFMCPILNERKKFSSVDDSYIHSLLSSALVLNEQRKVINKKIKDIKTTLKKVEEKI